MQRAPPGTRLLIYAADAGSRSVVVLWRGLARPQLLAGLGERSGGPGARAGSAPIHLAACGQLGRNVGRRTRWCRRCACTVSAESPWC